MMTSATLAAPAVVNRVLCENVYAGGMLTSVSGDQTFCLQSNGPRRHNMMNDDLLVLDDNTIHDQLEYLLLDGQ